MTTQALIFYLYQKGIFGNVYTMTKNAPLKLQDLVPKETTFTLSGFPGQSFTLGRWTLRVRIWVSERYTPEQLQAIFKETKIEDIGKIAYYLLKEKDKFPTEDAFFEAVSSVQDLINVITALLGAIGIGEPEIDQINHALKPQAEPADPNAPSPN